MAQYHSTIGNMSQHQAVYPTTDNHYSEITDVPYHHIIRSRLGLAHQPPIDEEHEHAHYQGYIWSRIRLILREPICEFWGTFVLIMFGDASVAQVMLTQEFTTAPGGRGYGEYQSVTWRYVSLLVSICTAHTRYPYAFRYLLSHITNRLFLQLGYWGNARSVRCRRLRRPHKPRRNIHKLSLPAPPLAAFPNLLPSPIPRRLLRRRNSILEQRSSNRQFRRPRSPLRSPHSARYRRYILHVSPIIPTSSKHDSVRVYRRCFTYVLRVCAAGHF